MKYNFDEPVSRTGSNSVKYDLRKDYFGKSDVLPMWVADMDFKTPPFILEALRERLEHGILGYSVKPEEFFTSIIAWLSSRHAWSVEREWISFCPGIVPAINICTLSYTDPDDNIIVQPPVYFPFFPAVTDHRRTLVHNQLTEEEGRWLIDFPDLRLKAADGAKMLLLSNPHNPVGRVWTRAELEELGNICVEHGVIIIADEIHSDLILPGFKHVPLASISKEIADITVTCVAPSKTFNLAGLATSALIISNPELRNKFNKTIESLHIGNGNIFGIEASIAAYKLGDEWLDQLLNYLKVNVEFVIEFCQSHLPGIRPVVPEATYMIWLDCRDLELDPEKLGHFFIENAGLGLNQGSTFGPGGDGFMRMNLACPIETVKEAMNRLRKAIKIL